MLIIFPDTNALYGDSLGSDSRSSVLRALRPGVAELHISPVVVAEVGRQRAERLRPGVDAIKAQLDKLEKIAGVDIRSAGEAIAAMAATATESSTKAWQELLALPAVIELDWPTTPVRNVVERELARRRPFIEKKEGAIGHRDTVIWLSLLELANRHPDDEIVFVTADNGFLDENRSLHHDLVLDLQEVGIAATPRVLNSLGAARELIDEAIARFEPSVDETAEPHATDAEAWLRAAAAEAVHRFCQSLANLAWLPEFDPRDGGYDDPQFDADLPAQLTELHVLQTEGPLATHIEVRPDGRSASATFDASLYFDGFIDKADWYTDDIQGVDLWDGDWNDHVVNVTAGRRLSFEAEIELEGDAAEVLSVKLVAVTHDV